MLDDVTDDITRYITIRISHYVLTPRSHRISISCWCWLCHMTEEQAGQPVMSDNSGIFECITAASGHTLVLSFHESHLPSLPLFSFLLFTIPFLIFISLPPTLHSLVVKSRWAAESRMPAFCRCCAAIQPTDRPTAGPVTQHTGSI